MAKGMSKDLVLSKREVFVSGGYTVPVVAHALPPLDEEPVLIHGRCVILVQLCAVIMATW